MQINILASANFVQKCLAKNQLTITINSVCLRILAKLLTDYHLVNFTDAKKHLISGQMQRNLAGKFTDTIYR